MPQKQTERTKEKQSKVGSASSPINTKSPNLNNSSTADADSVGRKKAYASKLGVSLSALSKKEEKASEKKIVEKPELNEKFTPIDVLNIWKEFTENLQEEHHLKNTMLNCLPDPIGDNIYEVVVNNPVQEQRLSENLESILTYVRTKLKNTHIEINVRVTIDNEKKLGFTSLEKYGIMSEDNEMLKRLKDEFGLELL